MLGKTLFMKPMRRLDGIRIPVKPVPQSGSEVYRSKCLIPVSLTGQDGEATVS